ncbi:UNVERIFIED_CONTAM: hypothetical protein Slati_1932300 [Sesamum latifolium]|uniref:Uncharacterized protein n=1 Tax=Sesamum latifolium TaxID=2727402 RepID=A0AAW2X2E7_9LAMI
MPPYGPWLRAPLPIRGRPPGNPGWKTAPSSSSSYLRTPGCTGAEIFGNFCNDQGPSGPRSGSGARSKANKSSNLGDNKGCEGDEVDSPMPNEECSRADDVSDVMITKAAIGSHETTQTCGPTEDGHGLRRLDLGGKEQLAMEIAECVRDFDQLCNF